MARARDKRREDERNGKKDEERKEEEKQADKASVNHSLRVHLFPIASTKQLVLDKLYHGSLNFRRFSGLRRFCFRALSGSPPLRLSLSCALPPMTPISRARSRTCHFKVRGSTLKFWAQLACVTVGQCVRLTVETPSASIRLEP